jgi:hypothetical protein
MEADVPGVDEWKDRPKESLIDEDPSEARDAGSHKPVACVKTVHTAENAHDGICLRCKHELDSCLK